MASFRAILGKMSNASFPIPGVSLLFVQSGILRKATSFGLHTHEFWQLEFVGGRSELLLADGVHQLLQDDIVVIPPRQAHGFRHSGHGETFFSAKFHLHDGTSFFHPKILRGQAYFKAWGTCAETLLKEVSPAGSLLPFAALISALFAFLTSQSSRGSILAGDPPCVQRAIDFLEHNPGAPVSVNELAGFAGVSRATLSASFQKHRGITIKEFIDQRRAHLAQRMLQFADLSISQVSDQLGFPDVFAFSRFFKRHSGCSPRHFRTITLGKKKMV